MSPNTGAPEPVDLFEFLRSIEVAAHRKKLTRMQERVGRLIAYDSERGTGGGVLVNDERIAAELQISPRRVWVHFRALVDAGWFVQTAKPTRGFGSSPGRRARYQCTRPPLDLGLMSPADLPAAPEQLPFDPVDNRNRVTITRSSTSDEKADNRLMVPSEESAHDPTGVELSFDGFEDNRLMVSGLSSDGPERENDTHSPPGGTPTDGPPPKPVPQQPKPQDAREPVDNPTLEETWASINAGVADKFAAALASNARHARPDPTPIARPDRE